MSYLIKKGATSQSIEVYIIDATDGTPETGVLWNTAGMDLKYRRKDAVAVSITEAALTTPALTDTWETGGFLEIGNGSYRLDLPDAAIASAAGIDRVEVFGTVTGMVVLPVNIHLTTLDLDTVMRGTEDANTTKTGYALSAAGNTAVIDEFETQAAISATGFKVNVTEWNSTAVAAPDTAGYVKATIKDGTGTGELDTASGVVKANLVSILGTALTETAGLIAAGFKKFFNIGTPTGTLNSLPNAVPGAAGGVFIAGANAATSITTALTANIIGDVTGAFTGNLSGSVGSVTTKTGYSLADGAITAAVIAANAIDADSIKTDAVTAIQANLATAAKLLKYVQLMSRSDAAIATDNATELTAINADGGTGVGDFDNTTDALESSSVSAADVADAVWDEAMAGHVDAGSAGKALADALAGGDDAEDASTTDIADAVCDELLSGHMTEGSLSMALQGINTAGSGGTSHTITITDGTNPLDNVRVWVTTDSAGSNIVAGTRNTNSSGEVTFTLDAGTYYVWKEKSGYNFTNPESETVS